MQYHQNESRYPGLEGCTDEALCAMAAGGEGKAFQIVP